jgi:hypothetical protein
MNMAVALKSRGKLGADLMAIAAYASLPFIRGRWFFVDPYEGNDLHDGLSTEEALASFLAAYDRCLTGRGDGICVISGGVDTASETTSYLTHELAFSKSGITVFGISSKGRTFGRARIATKTVTTGALTDISFLRGTDSPDTVNRLTGSFISDGFKVGDYFRVNTTGNGADATGLKIAAVEALKLTLTTTGTLVTETAANAGSSTVSTYCVNAITVTGNNNHFFNVQIANFNTDVLSLGGLVESGKRNTYKRVHSIGGAGATASASSSSLKVATSEEATFEKCVFGTDTVDRGNNASSEILFSGAVYRARFYDCETLAYVSTGTAHGAIKTGAVGDLGSNVIFKSCIFHSFTQNGLNAQATVVIGTAPTTGMIYLLDCAPLAYTNWADAAYDRVYVNNPAVAATAGGGIPTVR